MFARYGGMSIFGFLVTRGILPYIRAKMQRLIGVFIYKSTIVSLYYFVNTNTAKCEGRARKNLKEEKAKHVHGLMKSTVAVRFVLSVDKNQKELA
jgi:hypothetical protein